MNLIILELLGASDCPTYSSRMSDRNSVPWNGKRWFKDHFYFRFLFYVYYILYVYPYDAGFTTV